MDKTQINYFELFGLPVSLQVDPELLKKRYDQLSVVTQSDSVSSAEEAAVRTGSEKSSRLATAYEILQDPDETLRYVLQLKNLLTDEEEDALDPQFGMEVMDINEELAELEMDENQEQLMNVEQKTNRLLLKIHEDVATIIDSYKEDTTTEEELLQVKDFYFHKKYLLRILDRIRLIRNIASRS